MPVIDHAVHESTRIGDDYRYGCWNKPRPVEGQVVRSEFSGEEWPYVFSTECMSDMSLSDPACAGCKWRGSGKENDERVRKEGK